MGCCQSKPGKATRKAPRTVPAPEDSRPKVDPAAVERERVRREVESRIGRAHDLRQRSVEQSKQSTDEMEVTPCFPDGHLYRVLCDGTCYYYNDTLDCEMHVEQCLGADSNITPAAGINHRRTGDGVHVLTTTVYPLETVEFMDGTPVGSHSRYKAEPISEDYLARRVTPLNGHVVDDMEDVRRVSDGAEAETAVLRRCLDSRVKFVDLAFPPTQESLSRHAVDGRVLPKIAFQRPSGYLEEDRHSGVEAISGHVVPDVIDAGHLGDSWLTSAIAILAQKEPLVRQIFAGVVPAETKLGAYRVRLNKNGWWHELILDDFLPTVNGHPCFAKSLDDDRELWVSLLQKAYAKLHGSYAAITGGDSLHALQDFTGAPTYRLDAHLAAAKRVDEEAESLISKVENYVRHGYTVVVNTPSGPLSCHSDLCEGSDPFACLDAYQKAGLILAKSYVVKAVHRFTAEGVTLFKIHNPWMSAAPWKGYWHNECYLWNENPRIKEVCKPAHNQHGEFWMSWDDVSKYFDGLGVAYTHDPTHEYRIKGQFLQAQPAVALRIHVTEPVEVMLVLSQPDKRGRATLEADAFFAPIMLSVSRRSGDGQRVDVNSSCDPDHPSSQYQFLTSRDVAMRYTFKPADGPYFVVPRQCRKSLVEGVNRQYTIGILSTASLAGKLNVETVRLESTSRVFQNLVSFSPDEATPVEAACQFKKTGEPVLNGMQDILPSAEHHAGKAAHHVDPSATRSIGGEHHDGSHQG